MVVVPSSTASPMRRRRSVSRCSSVASRVARTVAWIPRSEEHTSELQSPCNLVCRLLLEKKKKLCILHRSRPPQDSLEDLQKTPARRTPPTHHKRTPQPMHHPPRDIGQRPVIPPVTPCTARH